MTTDKRREAFESRFPVPKGIRWDAESGQYGGDWPDDQRYFEKLKIWCAALDSVVIELPAMWPLPDGNGTGDEDLEAWEINTDIANAANGMRGKCAQAIIKIGLKVTP